MYGELGIRLRKLRSISHALITKVVVFLIAVACLTGIARVMINMEFNEIHLSSINQDNYFESRAFADESYSIIAPLAQLIGKYKSEEYILSGKTLTEEDNRRIEEELYYDFRNSYRYNPNLSEEENKHIYQEKYAKDIARTKEESMTEQVRNFINYAVRSKPMKELCFMRVTVNISSPIVISQRKSNLNPLMPICYLKIINKNFTQMK